jgi:hypothetical protein
MRFFKTGRSRQQAASPPPAHRHRHHRQRQRRHAVEHAGGWTVVLPSDIVPLEKRGTPPASKKAISDLINLRLRAGTPEERDTQMECLICAEDCQDGDILTTLPCGHIFHSMCVGKWLHRNCTCPTCRFELPTDDLEYEEERKQRMKERLPAQEDASTMLLPDTIQCIPWQWEKQHCHW